MGCNAYAAVCDGNGDGGGNKSHDEIAKSSLSTLLNGPPSSDYNAVPGTIKHGGKAPILFMAGNVQSLSAQILSNERQSSSPKLPWGCYDNGTIVNSDPGDF